nr:SJCHGC06812 protein [Schistosoma japonicum]
MAFFTYFDRDDVSFPKAAEFFRKASHEEREHAEKLARYQNKRGGCVRYSDIKCPKKTEFNGLEDAMNTALSMEKAVTDSLLKLHAIASKNNDPALTDFIESEFLHEQEEAIKRFADYLTETQRVGKGLGEYLFDKLTLNE